MSVQTVKVCVHVEMHVEMQLQLINGLFCWLKPKKEWKIENNNLDFLAFE
jgi:hypothetical protein